MFSILVTISDHQCAQLELAHMGKSSQPAKSLSLSPLTLAHAHLLSLSFSRSLAHIANENKRCVKITNLVLEQSKLVRRKMNLRLHWGGKWQSEIRLIKIKFLTQKYKISVWKLSELAGYLKCKLIKNLTSPGCARMLVKPLDGNSDGSTPVR